MSLARIRDIRRQGAKPAVVNVVIGRIPARAGNDPLRVHIRENADLRSLDWLPLVGVWVIVHWVSGPKSNVLAVVDALERTGAKLFGAAWQGTCVALTGDKTREQESAIRAEWEALCAN